MTGKEFRIGLVGAGAIAQVAQLPSLAGRSDVVIAGLVTRTEVSGRSNVKKWPIKTWYPTVSQMIDHAKLDAVFVLTPRLDHVAAVEHCLRSGLDVFCEKPLAPNAIEAHRIADLAEAQDRLLMVGFNRRFADVYVRGREVFRDGFADFCVAQKNRAGSEYRATFENAIHMVDLLRWYCGEPVEVSAKAKLTGDRFQEDGLMALIEFDSGAVGSLVAARTAGSWDERLDAYGGGRSVRVVAPDSVAIDQDDATHLIEMRPRAFGWANPTDTLGFRPSVDHFLDCLASRNQPLTNGREAARTQELLDQILSAGELPTEEDPDREWASHAQTDAE